MPRAFTDRELVLIQNREMGTNLPVPKERKKHNLEESRIQRNLIKWWKFAHSSFGVPEIVLMSVPNGGTRGNILQAITMVREGLRPGASDLFLATSRLNYHGLWIEMKRPGGKVSVEQTEFQEEMTRQGYAACSCFSFDAAKQLISDYLNGQPIF